MILFYFSDKKIHQVLPGFGVVTTGGSGTLLVDGWDTTTKAADVSWKYIEDQTLERNDEMEYLHDADYYAAFDPTPSDHDLLMAIAEILEAELS